MKIILQIYELCQPSWSAASWPGCCKSKAGLYQSRSIKYQSRSIRVKWTWLL